MNNNFRQILKQFKRKLAMQICGHHPFLPYEHNQFGYLTTTVRKELLVKSSSLRPRTPTVTSAVLEADKCEIIIKFPVNVDVEDTYDHFVSYKMFKNTFYSNI